MKIRFAKKLNLLHEHVVVLIETGTTHTNDRVKTLPAAFMVKVPISISFQIEICKIFKWGNHKGVKGR